MAQSDTVKSILKTINHSRNTVWASASSASSTLSSCSRRLMSTRLIFQQSTRIIAWALMQNAVMCSRPGQLYCHDSWHNFVVTWSRCCRIIGTVASDGHVLVVITVVWAPAVVRTTVNVCLFSSTNYVIQPDRSCPTVVSCVWNSAIISDKTNAQDNNIISVLRSQVPWYASSLLQDF